MEDLTKVEDLLEDINCCLFAVSKKHGDLGEKRVPAQISLERQENKIVFETLNKKRNTSLYPKGGLGLRNIEKRLNNYYHERYTLLARDVEDLFTVTLTIDI